MTEWEAIKALADAAHEYDPDDYDPEELLLVRKHCGNLFYEFKYRHRFTSQSESAKEDCLNALCNFDRFYRSSMTATEAERLMNELCYIRLQLGV